SMYSLRSSLYMRSVPMLPDPTIAAVSFFFSVIREVSRDRAGPTIDCAAQWHIGRLPLHAHLLCRPVGWCLVACRPVGPVGAGRVLDVAVRGDGPIERREPGLPPDPLPSPG